MSLRFCFFIAATLLSAGSYAGTAPFNLVGPTLEVKVTRGKTTLPASSVPNLAEGDQLWIKADLPATQSANYLMVAAFLTGSTNPPPDSWFFPCKTWKSCGQDGLTVTVPKGAQQVLIFMAPETGGDFRTLVSAVRGRPGAFVRASQDLNQAALDRSRLQRYLKTLHLLDEDDPAKVKEIAPLMARSLSIKVDPKCLDRIPELQVSCLTQDQDSLILNDGHSTSIVEALTSGPSSDLLMEVSFTEKFRDGYYSPYVASVLDIARIMDSFRTAQYQYIPALASVQGDKLELTLNAAPSFNDPKSVLVIALPAIEDPQLPPLHAVDPSDIYCANRTSLVLPVEGAPLVFSTDYAHDMTLTLTGTDGKVINLPAKANAARGGYVIDTSDLQTASLGDSVHASLQGFWGFSTYSGPSFELRNSHPSSWTVAPGDEQGLIVGRQDTIHLQADSVSCVDDILLKDPSGKEIKAEWKAVSPNDLEVKLPLQDAQPGAMTLTVAQYGATPPQPISMQGFTDAGHLDGFAIHAGDSQGLLTGSRLDEVAKLTLGNISFVPGTLSTAHGSDVLTMTAQTPQDVQSAIALKPVTSAATKVVLKDGRVLRTSTSVDAPRPSVTLIAKSAQMPAASSNIQLASQDQLPLDATLTFSMRSLSPANFARDETIEVATIDESFSTSLGLGNGGVRLENSKVALATLNPGKAFGPSAFGPLQFRVLVNGVAGDWQPLATLVRLPQLRTLKCSSAESSVPCKLSGSALFLVDSVSNNPRFDRAVQVPDGFTGETMLVPRPNSSGLLYLKLRDDPTTINTVNLGAQPSSAVTGANDPATPPAVIDSSATTPSTDSPAPVIPASSVVSKAATQNN